MNREIIEEVLEEQYIILTAPDGRTALQLAERYQPRIVLLDIMLPDMDGYEVCRKLRAMPAMASARIVMVTAKAMPSERARGFEAGADDYLSKPFDDAELLAAMRPAHHSEEAALPE
jgi:two-component system cell cycle response regulator